MSGQRFTYPGTIEESPHRLGGGYLFRRDELLVGAGSAARLREVLADGAFRRRITLRVVTREIFGTDLHHSHVVATHGKSDDHPDPGPLRMLLGRLGALLRTVVFLVRARGRLSLATERVEVNEAQGWELLRLQSTAGARLVAPLVVEAVREIELSDELSTFDVVPNHVGYPATHTHGGSVVPPLPAPAPADPTGEQGTGVVVAVLDNGVDENHSWLAHRVRHLPGRTAKDDGPWPSSTPPFSAGAPLPAYAGHGTFIAGQVVEAAPGATVIPVRVLDESGYGDDVSLARAIGELPTSGDDRPDVIVMALGGHVHSGLTFTATQAALRTHLNLNPQCAVIAAAGNENTADPAFPAAFRTVTGVAALTAGRSLACFSNHNSAGRTDWVEVGTQGVALVSAFLDTGGVPVRPQPRNGGSSSDPAPPARCPGIPFDQPTVFTGFAKLSGTSMAAGRLAGMVAAQCTPGKAADTLHQIVGAGAPRADVGVVI